MKKNVRKLSSFVLVPSLALLVGFGLLWFGAEPGWGMYGSVAPQFVQCDIGLSFPNAFGVGPLGLAPMFGGQILAADEAAGGLVTFVDVRGPLPCIASYTSPNISAPGNPAYFGLVLGFAGKLYATAHNEVLEIAPSGGHSIIRTLATGFDALGITVDPKNGDLYVTDQAGQTVQTISNPDGCGLDGALPCSAKTFANLTVLGPGLAIDGLAWSPDTFSLLVAANHSNQVILVDRNGKPSIFVTLPAGTHPDGIAFGLPETPLWTPIPFAFTNNNDGSVTAINMNTRAFSTIASGGTRGDFVAVDDQGCLLTTQTDRVTRLCANSFVGPGGLCNNLQMAAAGVVSCNFCVTDPSVKATIARLVKPICANLTCHPAFVQNQLCTLISYVIANAPNCTGLLTAARTLRDALSTVSPSPCPGT